MTETDGSARVTLLKLAGFAMGLFAVQTFWGFTWATLPLYLKELTGSNVATGIMLSTTGITGLFLPVLAGSLSDRIHTPLGRRRPMIIAGWILACAMLLLLMRINSLAAALPVIILAYTGFFFAIGPYFALLPDTVPVSQRSFASGVMFLVGGTGMLSYLIFAARLWDTSRTRPFLWVVVAVSIAVAILCVSVRENKTHGQAQRRNLFKGLAGQKNLLRFLAAMTLQWISLWMVSAFFVITCVAYFGQTVERAVNAFFVLNASFVFFALPGSLLATRLGLKRTTVIAVALLTVCFFCIPLIKTYSTMLAFVIAAGAGYGTVLAVAYPFFLRLLPEGNTAGYVGLYMSCQNGTLLVGPAVAGLLIDRFGYVSLFYGAAAVMLAGMIMYMTVRNPEAEPSKRIHQD